MSEQDKKPIVFITGIDGNLGKLLAKALGQEYKVVGSALTPENDEYKIDVTSPDSIELAFSQFEKDYGKRVAAVIHLAAYFDFTGEHSPLYEKINEQGTRNLLNGLQGFKVERFIYASTMLVHEPVTPGEQINEDSPIGPKWAYPESKAKVEDIIVEAAGEMPYAILRLAGVYGDDFAVPTLAHQIARIYERDLKSYVYAGNTKAGQSFIHQDDVVNLFERVVARRTDLPDQFVALAGEPAVVSYEKLQNTIGELVHGEDHWHTYLVPKAVAKSGAWLEEKSEPLVPDDLDRGEKPFIRPFMIDMASDHYALDIRRAEQSLDWNPKTRLLEVLPKMVADLKRDPMAWYQRNGIRPPDWMEVAQEKHKNPQRLRESYEAYYQKAHYQNIWAPLFNSALAVWLLFSPFTVSYESQWMSWSDYGSGTALFVLSLLSVSPNGIGRLARWGCGIVGLWVASAPLVFWAPSAEAYLNGTLVGGLVIALALLVRPFPHASPVAAMTGPTVPPGWQFSPSDWLQRVPIIGLAVIGLVISRYMAAYQLENIDGVWDPFFSGVPDDGKNGTEEIVTSSVSEAWPVPDAGLGALTYMLEILTGVIGSRARWRTMPWLVLLFGFMIIPLGAVSISFIIIQPILLGTWCTLCLIAAAAMLLQIPYSFDEIVATIQFLIRRSRQGRPWLLILFTGDSDDGRAEQNPQSEFRQPLGGIFKEIFTGGVSFTWSLTLSALIGIWLMFTRLTLGTEGQVANADHLVGALVLTVTVTATAEVTRPIRYLNALLGLGLLITVFSLGAPTIQLLSSALCGLLLIGLSFPRGPIRNTYGSWTKFLKL